jgi:hypothetical protein
MATLSSAGKVDGVDAMFDEIALFVKKPGRTTG